MTVHHSTTHIIKMKEQDYTASFLLDSTLEEVFKGINNVPAWWTDELKGDFQKLNDVFTVQFGDVHVSTQKVAEWVPNKKVVWLVTDSQLNFVEKKDEWTGTSIQFELSTVDNKTQVLFTHKGLSPSVQCWDGCSKGWDYFFKGSLYKWLTEGKGMPGL